jgi:hypothetical protein
MATIKLFESWLQSQAINEFGPHGGIDLGPIDRWNEKETLPKIESNPTYNMFYEKLKVMFKKNGIVFSCTPERAAAIMTDWMMMYTSSWVKTFPASADKWLLPDGSINLNISPANQALVLTTGKFIPTGIDNPADPDESSDYVDIAKFCNNSALLALMAKVGNNTGGGYKLKLDANGSAAAEGNVNNYTIKLYGTSVTSSAVSQTAIQTTTWTVPTEGKTIVKKLPGTMFATGSVKLSDSKELDAAIAELKALLTDKNTKLTKIQIESSASGDRPAADGQTGYPANHPAGTVYTVKPTDTSGNAVLARGRGETIKAKLASLGVPVTVVAQIQDGGDAAQYATLIATIEKVDKKGVTLSKQELETILLKPKSTTDLKSTFTLSKWSCPVSLSS